MVEATLPDAVARTKADPNRSYREDALVAEIERLREQSDRLLQRLQVAGVSTCEALNKDEQKTEAPLSFRSGLHAFSNQLRLSQRRQLAERFGLDMKRDPKEREVDRIKAWLLQANSLGCLRKLLCAAIQMAAEAT